MAIAIDKDLIKKFFKKLGDEFAEIRFAAASLAFSTLFSIIPFLLIVLALFQSIGGLENYYPKAEALILDSLKEATGSTVTKYLKTTITQVQSRTVGFTGVLFLIVATLGLFRNIDLAFHHIWKIQPKKTFLKRLWLHSLVLISLPVVIAAYIGLRSTNWIENFHPATQNHVWVTLTTTLVLWFFYTAVPEIKIHRLSSLISAVITSFVMTVIQSSFLWFALKIFKRNKIYGSLASLPIFLLWLLVVWSIILSGVSLCAFLQQKIFKRT